MSDPIRTAKVKLVTIVVPFERSEALADDLERIGIRGYTSTKADGRGTHGTRHSGFLDSANLRFEVLAGDDAAQQILALFERNYADDAAVAFMSDVEAVPESRFI